MGSPQIIFFAYYIRAPSDQFLCLLCGAPSDQILRILYTGPLRSVSSHTIRYPPPSGQFIHLLYVGSPLDKFLRYCMGPPSGQFLRLEYGPPRSISLLTMWGSLQISFFAYYIGGLFRSVSSLTIGGPLSSVSSHTIWGPTQIYLFAYYMWGPP